MKSDNLIYLLTCNLALIMPNHAAGIWFPASLDLCSFYFKSKLAFFLAHCNPRPIRNFTAQDHFCHMVLEVGLDGAFKGSCAIRRVISFVGEPEFGVVGNVQFNTARFQKFAEVAELNVHNPCHLGATQAAEQ